MDNAVFRGILTDHLERSSRSVDNEIKRTFSKNSQNDNVFKDESPPMISDKMSGSGDETVRLVSSFLLSKFLVV